MRLVVDGGVVASRRRSGRRARRLAAFAGATAGVLLTAGCQVPFLSSAAAGPTASGTLTVVAPPGIADAPLFIAAQQGMFKATGMTVQIRTASSFSDEVALLRSGRAQVAFGDYADIFYTEQGLLTTAKRTSDLVIVADGYDAGPNVMEVLTLPNSHITTAAQLQNKTIGTAPPQAMPNTSGDSPPIPYSLDTVATYSVLFNDGLDMSKVHWNPLPSTSLISALRARRVNAILATEPTIFEAETKLGAVPVVDSATGQTANLPLDGYFAMRSFAKDHTAQIDAFRAALISAQAAAAQSAPVQAVLRQVAHMPARTASLVTLGQYPTSVKAPNLQRIVNLMFSFGALGANNGVVAANMIAP